MSSLSDVRRILTEADRSQAERRRCERNQMTYLLGDARRREVHRRKKNAQSEDALSTSEKIEFAIYSFIITVALVAFVGFLVWLVVPESAAPTPHQAQGHHQTHVLAHPAPATHQ